MNKRVFSVVIAFGFAVVLPLTAQNSQKKDSEQEAIARGKAEWAAVLDGTHKPIFLPTDEARKMCEATLQNCPAKAKLCALIKVSVPKDPLQAEDTPGICEQASRLLNQFSNMVSQYTSLAAVAGAGCYSGMCPPCCALAAGYALQAAYYGSYANDMQNILFQNHCN